MSRRDALRLSGVALAGLAGCSAVSPSPSDAPPSFQFQYDSRNTGVSDSRVPDRPETRWRTTLHPNPTGLAVAGERVLVAGGTLVAIDATDGGRLWDRRVRPYVAATPAVTSDTAYLPTGSAAEGTDSGLVAVALDDGSLRWRAVPDADVTTAPTLAEGTLYAGGVVERTYALAVDARTGEEVWRTPLDETTGEESFHKFGTAPTPAVADGTVYVGSGEEEAVVALDAADGEERWRAETTGRVNAPPTVVGDTVYVGTERGQVYAVDAGSGDERWTILLDADLDRSFAATGDAVYVPGRPFDRRWPDTPFRAFAADGTLRWSVLTHGVGTPTLAGDALVYVAAGEDVVCLDLADRTERWRHEARERTVVDVSYGGFDVPPVVVDGVVYAVSTGGDVYALGSS